MENTGRKLFNMTMKRTAKAVLRVRPCVVFWTRQWMLFSGGDLTFQKLSVLQSFPSKALWVSQATPLFYLVPIKKLLPQQHRARQSDILSWVRAFKELLYLTRQKSWQKCRDSIRPLCLFPQKVTKLPFSSTRVWLSLQYPFSCQKNFCWFVWILHLQQWSE